MKAAGLILSIANKKVRNNGLIIGCYERGETTPLVEVAKKLAAILGGTLDYLVDGLGSLSGLKAQAMRERLRKIEALEQENKKTIVHMINSLLKNATAK